MARAPGEVRDALVAVFKAHKGEELTVGEIRALVEKRLGPVAPSSIRSYLRLGTGTHWNHGDQRGTYHSR
jgi:hypothetical protein